MGVQLYSHAADKVKHNRTQLSLARFAAGYSLKVVPALTAAKRSQVLNGKPKCDVEHIPGKRGWIRSDRGCLRVAVMGMKVINRVIDEMKRLGFEGCGRSNHEVMRCFDPENEAQTRYAVRVIQARHRRRLTEEQRQRVREMGRAYRIGSLAQKAF
jgi:hypothetical protein